ncbi:hypothetical protein PHYPO_G00184400 [Pangasianodon hypophthalmus]|uniref:Uncharacterized protein n=1 Tax=Pangasianodon hypophthalmus TaxID=310915 RepID=A0A5N5PRA8_PANHP|nr:hypothetical protein PHYPO_G00184400 [Pangasianodon hypophthalmus]
MSGTGEPNGDERERPGPCFGRMREEEEEEEEEEKMKALKPTCPGDEARGGTGVAMETASSDSVSDLFLNASSERSDLYTSLLSSNSSSSNPFSTSVPLFSSEDDRSPLAPLGSDSGIGMTPGDPCDLHTQKNEPYNYMDMSDDLCDLSNRSSTGAKKQPIRSRMDDDDDDEDKDEKGSMDFKARMEKEVFDLGSYLEKNPENLAVKGDLGNTFPYVEDQSDDELLEDRPRLGSPVKITVTMDSCILATEQARGGLSERESVLSLGKEGVPTVTLSEPEDDSAASSVNHSPSHSPTGRESPSDILFQPVGMKCVNNSALYQATKGPVKASGRFGTRDSGESGDSEIEPDSPRREKHSSAKDRPGNPFEPTVAGVEVNRGNKGRSEVSVNMKKESVQHGNPPLYSLLREEREAELDSDLLIESASEESPKREQVVKCTLKPSSPPSSPPPVSSAVSPPLKVKEQEVKEEKKEKPSAAPREESNTQPQQQEDKVFTKAKPEVMVSFEQRPLEDGGSKSTVMSTEAKKDPKEAELLLFLHNFNKQKGQMLESESTNAVNHVFM